MEEVELMVDGVNYDLNNTIIRMDTELNILTIMKNNLVKTLEEIDDYLCKHGCYFDT